MQPDSCRVRDIQFLTVGGSGVAWSHANNMLVFSRNDADNIKQTYVMRPDGTGEMCLTCEQVPGGPPVNVHKGIYSWHPSGRYIFLQVEMPEHPGPQALAVPGTGYYNNIWATTPDGSQWWQLTDYPSRKPHGVLYPTVSHDGTRLAWAELYRGPGVSRSLVYSLGFSASGNPWGYWRINIADLVIEGNDMRLENIRRYRPGNANWFEVQDWSPDDTRLLFAADINRETPHVGDIWEMEVQTGEVRAVTDLPTEWVEQAHYSPNGKKIAFMSSACCTWNPETWKSLATEIFLMDADGSHVVQLTHFNSPGYPESQEGRSVATRAVWSADGTQLIVEQFLLTRDYLSKRETRLWKLTFQGRCGA